MQTGKVQWFNSQKGFGFIKPDNGGADLFCHYSSIQADGYKSLNEGDEVTFTIGIGGPKNRQQAEGVIVTRKAKANGHG